MNRILILQRTFEHYRIPVFSELATRENIDLTIAFPYVGRVNSPYNDIDLQYRHIDLEIDHYSFPIVGEIFKYKNFLDVISKSNPDVIIAEGNPRIRTLYSLTDFAKSNGIKTVAWTKYDNTSGILKNFIWHKFLQKWDSIMCYGEISRQNIIEMGFNSKNVFVAQNTVEVDFSNEDISKMDQAIEDQIIPEFKKKSIRLVSLGSLVEKKKFDLVITAVISLIRKGNNVQLAIVGDGPERSSLENIVKKAIRSKHIKPKDIFFVGHVPYGNDHLWLKAAHISITGGAVGLAMNVSMSHGVPTIIPNEYGSDSELLINNVNGVRFEPNDVSSLEESLSKLVSDKKLRNTIGESAFKTIDAKASIPVMVDGFESVISHLNRSI